MTAQDLWHSILKTQGIHIHKDMWRMQGPKTKAKYERLANE